MDGFVGGDQLIMTRVSRIARWIKIKNVKGEGLSCG